MPNIDESRVAGLTIPLVKVAGPMWTGPLHKPEFITKTLANLSNVTLGTSDRIRGMLTLAQHVSAGSMSPIVRELTDRPFRPVGIAEPFLLYTCTSCIGFSCELSVTSEGCVGAGQCWL